MTIELNDESYIVGIWFSYDPKTKNDWLGCVIKDPNNPKIYNGWSRFRYVKDSKIFNHNDEDEKSWTSFNSEENQTDADMINLMDLIQAGIESGYPDKDRIIIKGNLKKLMSLSKNKDWMQIHIVH